MINTILSTPELIRRPVVLMDVGASGEIHHKWKRLARHAICVAFDPDKREMHVLDEGGNKFRKLFVINKIVAEKTMPDKPFYLTNSPYCSSTLMPVEEELQVWNFAALFRVVGEEHFNAITINDALREVGVSYIDWLKIDTQGTDLRIFMSVEEAVREKLMALEMEPGFIDIYKGEDKLDQILRRVTAEGFWLSSINVLGTQRINTQQAGGSFSQLEKKLIQRYLRTTPCWAELTFLNGLRDSRQFDERDFMLLYLFALLERQYGFCMEVAAKAMGQYNKHIFQQLHRYAVKRIKRRIYYKAVINAPVLIYKKLAALFNS